MNIETAKDAALAGGLVTSPAWVVPLSGLNVALTTATLAVGLAIGLLRLRALWRRRNDDDEGDRA